MLAKAAGGRHSRVFPRGARQGNGMKLQAGGCRERDEGEEEEREDEGWLLSGIGERERAPAASKSRYLRLPKCHGREESLLPLHLIGWSSPCAPLFLARE